MNNKKSVVDINVGGQVYTTTLSTLTGKYPESKLALGITSFLNRKGETKNKLIDILEDEKSRMFIDRDGATFRYILDYLRRSSNTENWIKKMIPSVDICRLRIEAEYFGLTELLNEIDVSQSSSSVSESSLKQNQSSKSTNNSIGGVSTSHPNPKSTNNPYYISIGCRGYYSAERDNPTTDMSKFRKITRITVSGRSDIAKEIFSGELNESRDPERYPSNGYTCRYYLTHTYLEYAFETLAKHGFDLKTSFSTGNQTLPSNKKEEFKQWSTYVEYLFYRPGVR